MKLGEVQPQPLLNSFFQDRSREAVQIEALRQWIGQLDFAMPTVFVTHQVVVTALSQIFPDSGEIVVTAAKRSENLQSVPISVSAITGDALAKSRVTSVDNLVNKVANLQLSSTVGDNTPIFSLRGVSMSDFSLNQSSPVATYYDEVYKGNFAFLGVALYDIERVEVLRGPQGTLYGKNTTAGAVNITTRKPSFDFEARDTSPLPPKPAPATAPAEPVAAVPSEEKPASLARFANTITPADTATTLADTAAGQRDSSVGVNVDEEMTELMSQQRAYQAAARLVTSLPSHSITSSTTLVLRW